MVVRTNLVTAVPHGEANFVGVSEILKIANSATNVLLLLHVPAYLLHHGWFIHPSYYVVS